MKYTYQMVDVNSLKPYSRNNYYFDDMTGDNWDKFVESVRECGVITPITITDDNVVVSGHQRVRACKELGIPEIKADCKTYETEDDLLLDLIYTNLRQRGNGNPNQVKLGRCIKELERIHGIRQGKKPNGSAFTQEDIAKTLDVSVDTIQNYKKLAEMIPELQELIMDGVISTKSARALAKRLSQDEQLELIESLDASKKYSAREIEAAVQEYKEKYDTEAQKREARNKEERNRLNKEIQLKEAEIQQLRAHPEKPADYDSSRRRVGELTSENSHLKNRIQSLQIQVDDYNRKKRQENAESQEYQRLTEKIDEARAELDELNKEYESQFELSKLVVVARDFLENKIAPVKFLKCFKMVRTKPIVGEDLIDIVEMLDKWSAEMHKITDQLPRRDDKPQGGEIDWDIDNGYSYADAPVYN